jgi:hypothetical protein
MQNTAGILDVYRCYKEENFRLERELQPGRRS